MEKTIVIFRVYKDGSVIALFPYEINYPDGACESYMKIGQHGAANYNHVVKNTKRASPEQYSELKKELECIGYDLEIRMRKGK